MEGKFSYIPLDYDAEGSGDQRGRSEEELTFTAPNLPAMGKDPNDIQGGRGSAEEGLATSHRSGARDMEEKLSYIAFDYDTEMKPATDPNLPDTGAKNNIEDRRVILAKKSCHSLSVPACR